MVAAATLAATSAAGAVAVPEGWGGAFPESCSFADDAVSSLDRPNSVVPSSPAGRRTSRAAWVSSCSLSFSERCLGRGCRARLSLVAVAIRACTLTTRPASRTLSTSASAAMKVYGPASRGQVRNASTATSSSLAITDTCDFDKLVMPSVSTSLSIGGLKSAFMACPWRSRRDSPAPSPVYPADRLPPGRPKTPRSTVGGPPIRRGYSQILARPGSRPDRPGCAHRRAIEEADRPGWAHHWAMQVAGCACRDRRARSCCAVGRTCAPPPHRLPLMRRLHR